MRVSSPERRDRLWLLNAFAVVLLTLLGAAGEAPGYDQHLKPDTVKRQRRAHSLFRQGCGLYDLIPNMPESRLRPLTCLSFVLQISSFSAHEVTKSSCRCAACDNMPPMDETIVESAGRTVAIRRKALAACFGRAAAGCAVRKRGA